ncbi:MAG: type IV pilus twitching motility protein PilT [Deltaproteobacteria bacterium]|nr:type IV pilus twitching motility protein PilT [Deltaproteobacteria bacterium]
MELFLNILKTALKYKASDIHLKAGAPPIVRVDGNLYPFKDFPRLSVDNLKEMADFMMGPAQKEYLREFFEVDLGYGVPGIGRFRVNVYQQRGSLVIAMRTISFEILDLKTLNMPPIVEKLVDEQRRGLILVTGTTGSGKSTTLASMIDYINRHRSENIITIEDPIEYLHRDRLSLINQREVGFDTTSFALALRSALRQDPDILLVGEMRDLETIEIAMTAAETGHLVLSTLHTVDAVETINRIISVFPPHQQGQVRLQLASILKGVISQRLIERCDRKGRVPAIEVLVNTPLVRECIADANKTMEIKDAIAKGHSIYGMQSFDQSILSHYRNGLISFDEALRQSSNPDDFLLKIQGVSSSSDTSWDAFDGTAEKAAEKTASSSAKTEKEMDIERFGK